MKYNETERNLLYENCVAQYSYRQWWEYLMQATPQLCRRTWHLQRLWKLWRLYLPKKGKTEEILTYSELASKLSQALWLEKWSSEKQAHEVLGFADRTQHRVNDIQFTSYLTVWLWHRDSYPVIADKCWERANRGLQQVANDNTPKIRIARGAGKRGRPGRIWLVEGVALDFQTNHSAKTYALVEYFWHSIQNCYRSCSCSNLS